MNSSRKKIFWRIGIAGVVVALGLLLFSKNPHLLRGWVAQAPTPRPLPELFVSLDRDFRPRYEDTGQWSTILKLNLQADHGPITISSFSLFLTGRKRTDANPPGVNYLDDKITKVALYKFIENSSTGHPLIAKKTFAPGDHGVVTFTDLHERIDPEKQSWLVRIKTTNNAKNAIIVGDIYYRKIDNKWIPQIETVNDRSVSGIDPHNRLARYVSRTGTTEEIEGLNDEYPVGSYKREVQANFN